MTNPSIEWYQSLDHDTEFLAEEAKVSFAVCLERRMKQGGMSKADLARRLKTSQAYVTKILRGDSNLTINTMVELASAVESSLHLHIAPRQADVRWFEIVCCPPVAAVSKNDRKAATYWAKYAKHGSHGYVPAAA
jgi:transcriptional regulator with XRE-family HTH domain